MQVYFFGWGFFALGHDDTLERKLTAQLTEPHARPNVGRGLSQHSEYSDASPQQDKPRVGCIAATSSWDRAAAGEGSEVAIGIETCTRETIHETSTANDDESCGVDGERSWAGLRKRMLRLLMSPNIIAVTIGVVIAMIPPLQRMLFANPRAVLRPLGAAVEV